VKASIHAVLGKCGVIPPIADIFGPVGSKMLDALVLPEPYRSRVASQRRIMAVLSVEIAALEVETARRLKDNLRFPGESRHGVMRSSCRAWPRLARS